MPVNHKNVYLSSCRLDGSCLYVTSQQDMHEWIAIAGGRMTLNLGVTPQPPAIPLSLDGPSCWSGPGLAGLLTQLPSAGHHLGAGRPQVASALQVCPPPPGGRPGTLLTAAARVLEGNSDMPTRFRVCAPITGSALSSARADPVGRHSCRGTDEGQAQRP